APAPLAPLPGPHLRAFAHAVAQSRRAVGERGHVGLDGLPLREGARLDHEREHVLGPVAHCERLLEAHGFILVRSGGPTTAGAIVAATTIGCGRRRTPAQSATGCSVCG